MNKMYWVKTYLNRGWKLTPVLPPKTGDEQSGKKPFLLDWPHKPVKSEEDAIQYWDEDKNYNMGILTGAVSGLIVLDVDHPEKFSAFLEKHPECRETYIVHRNNAPEGRNHYYFKIDGFFPKSMNCKTTGWGDLCSDGKQVVAPPSVHYTEGIYEVIHETAPLPFKKEYMDDLLLANSFPKEKEPVQEECIPFFEDEGKIPEGTRNERLFEKLKNMRDSGSSKEDAENAALAFCEKCNPPYPEKEALRTLESVYSYNTPVRKKKLLSELNYFKEKVESEDGEKTQCRPRPYDQVTARLLELLKGKIANINGVMVVLPQSGEEMELHIDSEADLFCYLGNTFKDVPDWQKGRNFMSKVEAFSSLNQNLPCLDGIERVPHYPPLKNVHYVFPELPAPNNKILEEFLNFFAPETEYDKSLILAMLMTPLWGGPEGKRAPFLITSKRGRAVGKSTLAEVAAKLLGQTPISASTKIEASTLTTRLLSRDAMNSRIVLFDNEDGKSQQISNAGMASLFTSSHISGRKLYVGEGSRKNTLVWIMTLNAATLDSDFASRCISIALEKPPPCADWLERLNSFIEKYHWTIIATLIDHLKRETPHRTPVTRWEVWENEVLAKVPNIKMKEVLELIVSRQKENDSEGDEKETIVEALKDLIQKSRHDIHSNRFFIDYSNTSNLVRDTLHLQIGNTWCVNLVKEIINKGDYPAFMMDRLSNSRGFCWSEEGTEDKGIIRLAWKMEGK